jgi:cobalt-zinc-cadmium efflux system outer membrane protein
MSTITNRCLLVTLIALGAASASARENPFAPVENMVKQRTRREVVWERDLAAREDSRARIRALLKKPLTSTTAVQVALLNNRELQATFEEIGLSFADLREARMLANPVADLSIKFPDRAPTAPLYEWGVAQNFLNLLLIPLRSKVARTQLLAAQMRVSDDVVKLVSEVKAAYFEVLADQQLISQLRVVTEAQAGGLDLTQKLHEAGNVTDLTLLREQAQYSQRRIELATAETELRGHREKLNRLLGVWGSETMWKIADEELPPVPETDVTIKGLEALAVGNRLDLAAARTRLESAVKSAGLEKTFRFIGSLDFGAAGEHDPDGANLAGPAFRLELPLFNQGQARIARSQSQLSIAAAKFEQLAIDIRSDVRELRDRLISKRDIAHFYRDELVPTRRRITAHTLLQYNAMLVGAFEAFQARQDDVEAQRRMIEATRDYWITRSELERTVGGDLDAKSRPPALPAAESKAIKSNKTRVP